MDYFRLLTHQNRLLPNLLRNRNVAKLVLVSLFLGEGSKNTHGSLVFGNSNPKIISLFLKLLRFCYVVDENKFRCTLQCRADQKIDLLNKFWSKITKIPLKQFYAARIDPRSIGKMSHKKDYRGVCRIDYFSANIFNELTVIANMLE